MKRLLSLLVMMTSMIVPAEEESRSALQLGSPFGDHAVLQRDVPLPIWGWGGAHERVVVAFGGKEASTRCDGMKTLDGESPKSFWISGEDRMWHRAKATIEGAAIRVSSPAVPKPVVVRYAYAACPKVNLVGSTGLPAEPFRTDNWN